MSLANTDARYGSVAKTFHWMTALLILTALPLGVIAQQWAFETNDQLATKAMLFSAHKTVGILAFFTAFLRILWALSQKRPGLLNAENKLEATAAETAHWLLYGSMLLVPFTGWVHHAATEGFAPILLPIGQNLPFVPKSEGLAAFTSGLHFVLVIVLALTILAHIGGALKHFVIDKDETLQRMLPGREITTEPHPHQSSKLPLVLALSIWAIAMGLGTFSGVFQKHEGDTQAVALAEVTSDWAVTEGALELQITQFGAPVAGVFDEWTAQITFDETGAEGRHGSAKVEIAIGSLSLGSVTQQAMGADFFDAAAFPTAVFEAEILAVEGNGYLAEGHLTLKGVTVPVTLPFDMEIVDGIAKMAGAVTLSRQDFGIGATMPDETNLGFAVEINVSLTATQQ